MNHPNRLYVGSGVIIWAALLVRFVSQQNTAAYTAASLVAIVASVVFFWTAIQITSEQTAQGKVGVGRSTLLMFAAIMVALVLDGI